MLTILLCAVRAKPSIMPPGRALLKNASARALKDLEIMNTPISIGALCMGLIELWQCLLKKAAAAAKERK